MSRPNVDGFFWDELLPRQELIALAEAFGGIRLHVPRTMTPTHHIAKAIGFDAAMRLWDALGEGAITVPLYRELRAVHYREKGFSYAQIARKLGITEKGVSAIFSRIRDRVGDTE